jgi:CheY-like chemotaxis protein
MEKRHTNVVQRPILVVEDNVEARELVAQMLSAHGYGVVTAADGAQARSYVEKSLPQLVILDLIVPEPNGFQLLMEWRSNERTADLPVMILTGKELTHEELEYLQKNAKFVVSKQSRWREDLAEQLQRVLSSD